MLPGAPLDRAWVARFAPQPHRLEEGAKTGERTRTTRCTNAHARSRHRVPRLSLPAPRDGPVSPLANQVLHQRRLRIEHVNSSVKRCRIVKDRIRLWKEGIRDLVMELCCALHN